MPSKPRSNRAILNKNGVIVMMSMNNVPSLDIKLANAFDIITMYNKYRLLYGRDVPLGHTGVVATPVPIWPKGTHRPYRNLFITST